MRIGVRVFQDISNCLRPSRHRAQTVHDVMQGTVSACSTSAKAGLIQWILWPLSRFVEDILGQVSESF